MMRKKSRKSKGSIFVVSAPSGAGKTTLCRKIVTSDRKVRESVSFTTRPPREGEKDGVDYNFVSEAVFREMVSRSEFVEWAEVHGNLYGTSRRMLKNLMDDGLDVLLDIDVQGARQIRKTYKEGVFIFILPPSYDILRRRLGTRGDTSEEEMERRLGRALDEIRDYRRYDYVIVNDRLNDAVKGLAAVIAAQRLRTDKTDTTWIKENFLA